MLPAVAAAASVTTLDQRSGAEPRKRVPGRPFAAGNPGRPIGSRNKLAESFLEAIAADFAQHGIAAIAKVRDEDPATYMRVIAGN